MKTRLVALALTLCILFTLVPTALAVDGEAADRPLYYKYAWQEEDTLSVAALVTTPGHSIDCVIYTDKTVQSEVKEGLTYVPDDSASAGAFVLTRDSVSYGDTSSIDVWYISAKAFGSGRLVYEKDGTRYSMAVSSVLPEQGFFSTTEPKQETYLITGQASFVVGKPFYCILPAGTVIESAGFDMDSYTRNKMSLPVSAEFEILSEKNICKITVTEVLQTQYSYPLWFTFGCAGDSTYTEFINLQDATPRFGFRWVRWSDGQPNGFHDDLRSRLDTALNTSHTVGFFFGETAQTVTSVTFVPNDETDAGAVTAARNSEHPQYWDLDCVKLGSGVLRCVTADSKAYDLPVRVMLPSHGFFKIRERSAEAYIAGDFLYDAANGSTEFWLLQQGGLAAGDTPAVTCEYYQNGWQTADPESYLTWERISRGNGTDGAAETYDVRFTVKSGVSIPESGLELQVRTRNSNLRICIQDAEKTVAWKDGPSAMTVTIGGTEYLIGFGFEQNGIVTLNTDGRWSQGYTLPPQAGGEAGTAYRRAYPENSWGILAAVATTSETEHGAETIYTPVPALRRWIRVDRVWLERRSGSRNADGNTNTFSFGETRQLELNEGLTAGGFPIRVADIAGDAYLCAEITVNGETSTIYYTLRYQPQEIKTVQLESVASINSWLSTNAATLREAAEQDDVRTHWRLELNGTNYEGDITLPEQLKELGYSQNLEISILGQKQTFKGTIDLGGTAIRDISGLNFVAKETGKGTAIANGSATVYKCSFTGYETALGGGNTLMPHACTFKNNGTAVVLRVPERAAGATLSLHNGNLFENNGTAVRIESTNDFVTPFNIRFCDSAFIGNTTDIDVRCAGTFYFLRNYYQHTGAASPRLPVVNKVDGANVFADLVWTASPLTTSDAERQLVLNSAATALPNDADTQATVIDTGALTTDTRIDLADERGETVASWSWFGSVPSPQRAMRALRAANASAGAADGFRPGVDIQQMSADTLRVTVADSAALQSKQPLLTIPYTLPNATVTGPNNEEIAYTLGDGKLSFRVSTGGTYTVTAALPQAEYADGTITVTNAPAEAKTAIAAVYGKTGQLLQTAVAAVQNGKAELPLTVQAGQNCRVFLLDQGNKPVCSTIEP